MTDWTKVPWNNIPFVEEPDAQISANFRLKELYASSTAAANGIDNWFDSAASMRAAIYLCRQVMQPIRDNFGPFTPNSVFRSNELDRVLKNKPPGWQSPSQHVRGQACDIEVPGQANFDLAAWVRDNLTFDQLILEKHNPANGPNSGWVHVSLKPPGRGEVLSYIYDPGQERYVYVQGLRTTAG